MTRLEQILTEGLRYGGEYDSSDTDVKDVARSVAATRLVINKLLWELHASGVLHDLQVLAIADVAEVGA